MKRLRTLRRSAEGGFTFIELVISTGLLMILASAALPLARISIKRQRESDLRYDLRMIRTAIDKYKDAGDRGQISTLNVDPGSQNYPPDLQTLVDGVQVANTMTEMKLKFLRNVPFDPMTGKADWGMRAVGDTKDSKAWGGGNVFDIYSKAAGTALDGTKYIDW